MKRVFFLKILSGIICFLALIVASYCLYNLIINVMEHSTMSLPDKLRRFPGFIDYLCLSIMGLFITFRAKSSAGSYLIAIFLGCYVLNNAGLSILPATHLNKIINDDVTSNIIGVLLVYALQNFPQRITAGQIAQTLKNKYLKRYLMWWLKPINLWLYFLLIISSVELIFSFTLGISLEIIFEIFICLTAWLFMLVSYRQSAANSRNSLLWLFWGILCYVFLIAFYLLGGIFVGSQNPYLVVFLKLGVNIVIVSMFFMSIFFADSFDTGFIIKRTLIDGLLFLIVIVFYNTIEHFAMHSINEYLGISDVFASSLLSGVLVLILSPLHHRLNNFLNHKLKHNEPHDAGTDHHKQQHIAR